MATLLFPLNSLLLMHLWGGGSSLCRGYLTRDKHFKSTTLKRDCKGDERHSDIWLFFFFPEKKKKKHPFVLCSEALGAFIEWAAWSGVMPLTHCQGPLSHTQQCGGKGTEQRHIFGIGERGLNYSLK